jgi:hypothetical protein
MSPISDASLDVFRSNPTQPEQVDAIIAAIEHVSLGELSALRSLSSYVCPIHPAAQIG